MARHFEESSAAEVPTVGWRFRGGGSTVERLTPPELVSVAQSALQLGVSARTIRRWVRARQIPFVKLGNTVRIDLTAVRAIPAGQLQRQVDVARGLAG
jgi:excisionase family DNA binding protein